jgi:hypothetical protein
MSEKEDEISPPFVVLVAVFGPFLPIASIIMDYNGKCLAIIDVSLSRMYVGKVKEKPHSSHGANVKTVGIEYLFMLRSRKA